jgi:multidrug transporter EmrE-like cation transporter
MTQISLHPIVWLVLSGLFFAAGEYLSKSYVLTPRPLVLVWLITLYMVGALLWLPALKQKPDLAVTGTLWSVITLLMTVAIGVLAFGEVLSMSKILGILLAVGAVILLSL